MICLLSVKTNISSDYFMLWIMLMEYQKLLQKYESVY